MFSLTRTTLGPPTVPRLARALLCAGAALLLAPTVQAQEVATDPATGEVVPAPRTAFPAIDPDAPPPSDLQRGGSTLTLLARLADGETRGIALDGSTLYRSNGGYLEALDVSDPSAPSVLDRFLVDPSVVQGVTLGGDLAYVTSARALFAQGAGLYIVDVSDPADLQLVGSRLGRSYYDVALDGTTAFVAAAGGGLRVVDVADPAAPAEVATLAVSGGSVLDVELNGTTAYLSAGNAGLRIADVSDPAAPAELGFVTLDGFATKVVAADGRAYVTVNGFGLYIVDVSTPATPTVLGSYLVPENNGQVRSVALDGTTAYVGGDFGVVALDVTDPAAIAPLDAIGFGVSGTGQSLVLDASTGSLRAFTGGRFDGVRLLDLSDPADLGEIAYYPNGGFSFKVTVQDGIAYVVDLIGQLRLIDLSDPAQPVLLSRVTGVPNADWVDVEDGIAYLADRNGPDSGLTRIDVTDPTNPVVLGTTGLGSQAFAVDVVGSTAYVANGPGTTKGAAGSFLTVDVSGDVSVLDEADPGNQAFGVRVADDRAYVATFGSGLSIFDVGDPASIVTLSLNEVGGFSSAVEVEGETVYLADAIPGTPLGLSVIDASNPREPVVIGTGDVVAGAFSSDVAKEGRFAYITTDRVALDQYDVSDPSTVVPLERIVTADRPTGVDTEGRLVVLADAGAGVWVFEAPVNVAAGDGPDARPALQTSTSPNPAQGALGLRVDLPEPAEVTVEVFSVLGARVARVVAGSRPAGLSVIDLDASGLASGVYLYRVTAGDRTTTGRLTVAR